MKVIISERAERQLKNLSKIDQIAVAKKVRYLRDNKGITREEKLKGFKHIYRIRIGDLRLVYQKKAKEIYLILIGQRKDIYQIVKRLIS